MSRPNTNQEKNRLIKLLNFFILIYLRMKSRSQKKLLILRVSKIIK